jgi:hypothetical protein
VTEALLEEVAAEVPDSWLDLDRRAYVDYLLGRLAAPRAFVAEAEAARGR